MENSKNDVLMPNMLFWEAVFSSFQKITQLANYFTELKQDPNNDNYPFSKLFYDLFNNNNISIKKFPEIFLNIIISRNRQDLLLNPRQLFNFLLEELHNELILLDNKVVKEEKINKISNKKEIAEELFDKYEKKNKSFIQKLFFGRKQIKKICQICKSTTYELQFLKFCPINIQKVQGNVGIEQLYNNIQREFENIAFCKNCNKNEKCKIKIDIVEEPKILILFIYNYTDNIKIEFSETFNDNYKIKSIIMGNESLINNFLCSKNNKDFVSYGKEKSNFFKFEKGDIKYINKKELDKGNPYIIFYIKKEEKENQNYEEINLNDFGSKEILNKGKKNNKSHNKLKTEREKRIKNNEVSNTDDSNKDENDKNNRNIKNKTFSKSTVSNEKNDIDIYNNIFDNDNKRSGIIRLYFKFEDGKIIFIDVENYITFEKILNKLKEEYKWVNLDVDNLYFRDKQIDKNDIPKKLGIIDGDYIEVYTFLVD